MEGEGSQVIPTGTTVPPFVFNHPVVHAGPPVALLIILGIVAGLLGGVVFAALYYPWHLLGPYGRVENPGTFERRGR